MLGEVIVLCGFELFAHALPIPIRKVRFARVVDRDILDKPEDMVVGSRQSDDGELASADGFFDLLASQASHIELILENTSSEQRITV